MTENDFKPRSATLRPEQGTVGWEAPSNIALVKYWGKNEGQLPANASLSFTLNSAVTKTRLTYSTRVGAEKGFSFELLLDGVPEPSFQPKVHTFFSRISPYLDFLGDYHFKIETTNSFPHSSGIASSASGMAALALCLAEMEQQISSGNDSLYFNRKASFLARLGSGSASRSVQGPIVVWGEHAAIPQSSNLYGIGYPHPVHEVFNGYRDTILLVDKGIKQVSSTLGHGLMKGHAFANSRFKQAARNLEDLQGVFASGDLAAFSSIVESEALSLHAMMLTSQPAFILMKPNTLEIISQVWAFREETGLPVCFTLDAGANVHLLYPQAVTGQVMAFIKEKLLKYCEEDAYICDQIGFGAKKM